MIDTKIELAQAAATKKRLGIGDFKFAARAARNRRSVADRSVADLGRREV